MIEVSAAMLAKESFEAKLRECNNQLGLKVKSTKCSKLRPYKFEGMTVQDYVVTLEAEVVSNTVNMGPMLEMMIIQDILKRNNGKTEYTVPII